MTAHRGYVGAPGEQVHYREHGDAGDPPVVWLHQTASSSAMWERVLPLIPGVRHLALDSPGFGGSDPLPGAPAIGDYAQRLLGAVTALTDGPVLLVGHHTGAVIAGEVAIARPDLFRAMVLIGCVVIADDDEQARARGTYDHWEIDARGDYVVEHIIPRLLKSVTRDDPGQMAGELVAYLQAGPEYTRAYDAVYGYRAAERLPLVTTPTWCAIGEQEGDPMPRWTKLAAGLIPGASFTPIAGAGCELAFEEPAAVAALVAGVIAATTAGGTAH
jgi:haloalkane dehalogenase